jgi:hypothetical protein
MNNNNSPFKSNDYAFLGVDHFKTFTFGNIQISFVKVEKNCASSVGIRAEFLLPKTHLLNLLKSLLLGVTDDDRLEQAKLSKIDITEKGVHLIDSGRIVQLCPLALAVYTTFLLHTKQGGLRLKDLKTTEIKAKLCHIYAQLRPIMNEKEVAMCIDKLVNTDDNKIYEVISRINKKFKEELSDEECQYYGISGGKNEAKTILAAKYVGIEVFPAFL